MTKEKAMEILSNAFNSIFDEIKSDVSANRDSIVEEALFSLDIEKVRSLVSDLDTIDKAISDIDRRKATVNSFIVSKDNWCDWSLLCELNRAFYWLPSKDEAE